MSFIRTRTINGRQYRYLETRWREGKKVRSRSTYLGPGNGSGNGSWAPNPHADHGVASAVAAWEASQKKEAAPMQTASPPAPAPPSESTEPVSSV